MHQVQVALFLCPYRCPLHGERIFPIKMLIMIDKVVVRVVDMHRMTVGYIIHRSDLVTTIRRTDRQTEREACRSRSRGAGRLNEVSVELLNSVAGSRQGAAPTHNSQSCQNHAAPMHYIR